MNEISWPNFRPRRMMTDPISPDRKFSTEILSFFNLTIKTLEFSIEIVIKLTIKNPSLIQPLRTFKTVI
jgi:hypothetical protein